MTGFSCISLNSSPKWGMVDLFAWKFLPERSGGGKTYIQRFKNAWIKHNKARIKMAALNYKIPSELLAGVCWIEVGGDPSFIDRVAFEIRSLDWSGPAWVDKNLTLTKEPAKTSFGSVSMQLRTAAKTFGIDPEGMSAEQLRSLASCLQRDAFNIDAAARHLRQLIDHDGFQKNLPSLSMDQVRIIGARYNRGINLSVSEIKKNTSYGDFIVKVWPRLSGLLR
jgi:hypothetical protein